MSMLKQFVKLFSTEVWSGAWHWWLHSGFCYTAKLDSVLVVKYWCTVSSTSNTWTGPDKDSIVRKWVDSFHILFWLLLLFCPQVRSDLRPLTHAPETGSSLPTCLPACLPAFSHPRYEGWPHHERSFSNSQFLHLSSTFLISSVSDNPVHDFMLSIHVILGLPRVREPGVLLCINSFSRQSPFLLNICP